MNSSVDTEVVMICGTCRASVYREHIDRGLAGMWAGQLLCPACLRLKREGAQAEVAESLDSLPLAPAPAVPTVEAAAPAEPAVESPAPDETGFGLPVPSDGRRARHVRTFHAKLSEAALRHMDEQVNAWLKRHPEIEIRFANTTVGMFEGKHSEPALIMSVFY
jgi:hypothetical protein